jgi:hypothetical protein
MAARHFDRPEIAALSGSRRPAAALSTAIQAASVAS